MKEGYYAYEIKKDYVMDQIDVFNRIFEDKAKVILEDNQLKITIGKTTMVMLIDSDPESITACPYCHAKNPDGPHSFPAHDENRPGVVVCPKCGEIPLKALKGAPQVYFSHYEEP